MAAGSYPESGTLIIVENSAYMSPHRLCRISRFEKSCPFCLVLDAQVVAVRVNSTIECIL
jgi:hypothetical protein